MIFIHLFTVILLWNSVHSLGGSEEKFIKKYAMMKVYESCFGSQVLKEIRKEMREAAQKCSGIQHQSDDKYPVKDNAQNKPTPPNDWYNQELPYRIKPSTGIKLKKPIHTTDTLLLQQWSEQQKQGNADVAVEDEQDQTENDSTSGLEAESPTSTKKPVDISKLEEAILNIGRPMNSFILQKPSTGGSKFPQSTALGYYPPMFYPPPMPFPPSYPYHPYYPGYFQSPAGPVNGAAFQSIYRNGLRSAKITNFNARKGRQSDFKTQIESLVFSYSTKFRNISCIMQELGYLDTNLQPNYSKMNDRISKLHIDEELKKDILEGVKFCKQFSQCIPETPRDTFQLSKELLRPMFFFRCYKHKKLESCIMKDIRERVSHTSAELNNEVRRSFSNNDIIEPIFDSLFGSTGEELESPLF